MIKKILFGFAFLATVASCTDDDYTDWAQPQANPEPEAITFGNGSVSETALIDFATISEEQKNVKVCNVVAPTATDEAYSKVTYLLNIGSASYGMTADGEMAAADLKKYVEDNFGKAPVERTMTATVEQWISNGATTVKTATSGEFAIKAKLNAPDISEHYYIIGQPSAWDPACTTLPFTHSEQNVYDDPVFTVMFDASCINDEGDIWFAITDDKTVAANDWSMVLGIKEGNGNVTLGETGYLARRNELTDDGSLKVHPGEARFVKVTLNMMEGTYLVELINFQEYLYVAGSGNGWGQNDFISSQAFDGNYKGFMWLGNEFKLCTQQNWDGTNYGKDFSTAGDAANMTLPEGIGEGYCMLEASLVSKTITVTPITTIGVIGDATASGWDASTPLTYNKDKRCWEGDVTFTAGTFKFRANDAWDINWGGDKDNLAMDGDNIAVEAGTYHVALYPNCPGKAMCTIEPK